MIKRNLNGGLTAGITIGMLQVGGGWSADLDFPGEFSWWPWVKFSPWYEGYWNWCIAFEWLGFHFGLEWS